MKKKILHYFSCLLLLLSGCTEFLELKPDVRLSTPETLADLRALLNDEPATHRNYIGMLEFGVDDYFIPYAVWAGHKTFYQDVYLWKPDPQHETVDANHMWTNTYNAVALSNIVLETLVRNKLEGSELANQLKGEALFNRSLHFFYLIQVYATAYNPSSAAKDLGIPLRLSSSINQQTKRATLAECYDRILADLLAATELLPESTGYLTRPTKAAAYGLLSRVYLAMGNFQQSLLYAESGLKAHPQLWDYNTLDLNSRFAFPILENVEILYFGLSTRSSFLLANSSANADSLLYSSFANDDLRKKAFFVTKKDGYQTFNGQYSGYGSGFFAGIASSELYLNKAECLMRLDRLQEGMDVLNQLLAKRWKTGTFTPFLISDKSSTLKLLYAERRKELIRRGLRWMDLKRLNREPEFAKTLFRKLLIDGKEEVYELPPNDLRYVHLIPQTVVDFTGIPQNPR